jgi:hypothetical protein
MLMFSADETTAENRKKNLKQEISLLFIWVNIPGIIKKIIIVYWAIYFQKRYKCTII